MNTRRRTLACLALLCIAIGAPALGSTTAIAAKVHVFSGSFGSEGSGDGEFKVPSGVAVSEVGGSAGDVYVVDEGNNRVEHFNAAGVYLSQFDGSVGPPTGAFSAPEAIVVDNSGSGLDPSSGDIYVEDVGHSVIDKFSPAGTYEGQLTGTCPSAGACPGEVIAFSELRGLAIDTQGALWAYEGNGNVDEFSDTGSFVQTFNTGRATSPETGPAFAIDASDNIYLLFGAAQLGKYNATFEQLASEETEAIGNITALAISPTTNGLLVDQASSIAAYGPFGEPFSTPNESFPAEGLTGSHGVAVNGHTGTVYATQREAANVEIFSEVPVPAATTSEASDLHTEGSATLNGTVNPEGVPVTSCEFEYGPNTSYGSTTDCTPTAAELGSGTSPVAVSANVSGLAFGVYHFRLVAGNVNGETPGEDHSFVASAHPTITNETLTTAGATTATITAQVNPGGLPTTYSVEYGTTTGYGSSTPEASLGAGLEAAGVQVQLSGLQPQTAYHARVVARNAFGTTLGIEDIQFTTAAQVASGAALPDDRAYELVSTTGNFGEVYAPDTSDASAKDITTRRLFQSSADGDAVSYLGTGAASGGNGGTGPGAGNEWLARRTEKGWSAGIITPSPSGEEAIFESFSSDLTSWILRWAPEPGLPFRPLTSDAPAECKYVPYLHASGGGYQPLITATISHGRLACGNPTFAGASGDGSQILTQSQAPLTAEAVEAEEPSEGHSATSDNEKCSFSCNLYDWAGGQLRLVNLLPGGETVPNATFGGQSPDIANPPDFSNVISADGSRVFWTDTQPGLNMEHIYVRENGTSTAPVSAGAAKFWTATPDGRYALYTEAEKLFRFDVETNTREQLVGEGLLHESAEVQGVVGINQVGEDGSYVYFVAGGALAPGATPQVCKPLEAQKEEVEEKFEKGLITEEERNALNAALLEEKIDENEGKTPPKTGCNLYVLHEGHLKLVATLSPVDDNLRGSSLGNNQLYGDWRPDVGSRTAQVTPDGRHLVFESIRSLTGYDNIHIPRESHPEAEVEAFVYAADEGLTVCASCSPTGAAPQLAPGDLATRLNPGFNGTHMRRWITDDGARVFFMSGQPLVSQDPNGVRDVYQWEKEGGSSCPTAPMPRRNGGCVFLLSGGESADGSYFAEATANGSDVFFATREQLVAQERGEKMNLYDARVAGGFPEPSLACTGSGCQGVPPAPPTFATPPSATFSGAGNFPASAPPPPTKKTAAQIRAERLTKALKACRVKRNKHQRRACEAQARKRYAPLNKSKSRKGGK